MARLTSLVRCITLAATALMLIPPPASAAPAQRELGAAVAPIRLRARGPHPIAVSGLNSYFDTVELDAAGDGLVVSNRLSLERYLLGLSEVPSDWPLEALKAQAVAARTYALFTLGRPRYGAAATYGFDICATTDCQVFSGADKLNAAGGMRWARAVGATEGHAIFYDGAPILARYHSTSGGRTLSNSEGFPGDADYPYLRSVESPWEEPAPLFRWEVRFRVREIQRMLERAGRWRPDDGRLTSVTTARAPTHETDPEVTFRSDDRELRLQASVVREIFRSYAPRLFPGRYPSLAPTSLRRLPETLPSHRVEIVTRRDVVRIVGHGWGHGVGMSQWGAHGLAQRGAGYLDILGHYYPSTTVEPTDARAIEVGVEWGRSEVTATGSFDVVDGRGRVLERRALGSWRFRWQGDGVIGIDPPAGHGLPLQVGIAKAPARAEIGSAVFLTVALSRPAKVQTKTFESPTAYEDPGVRIERAGKRRIPWLAPLEPGTYRVVIRANAGGVERVSEPVEIEVVSLVEETGGDAGPRPSSSGGPPWWVIVAGVLVLLALWLITSVGRIKG